MKARKFLIPILASLVATPPLLFVAVFYTRAGHGSYFLAKILFPFTMLSTVLFGSIVAPFVVLAILQFPLYGILLGRANATGTFGRWELGILIVHLFAVAACFLLVGKSFA